MCTVFGKKVIGKLDLQPINKLLGQARKSSVTKTKNYGYWVTKELAKLTPASW